MSPTTQSIKSPQHQDPKAATQKAQNNNVSDYVIPDSQEKKKFKSKDIIAMEKNHGAHKWV
jgi:hypothetical protein